MCSSMASGSDRKQPLSSTFSICGEPAISLWTAPRYPQIRTWACGGENVRAGQWAQEMPRCSWTSRELIRPDGSIQELAQPLVRGPCPDVVELGTSALRGRLLQPGQEAER